MATVMSGPKKPSRAQGRMMWGAKRPRSCAPAYRWNQVDAHERNAVRVKDTDDPIHLFQVIGLQVGPGALVHQGDELLHRRLCHSGHTQRTNAIDEHENAAVDEREDAQNVEEVRAGGVPFFVGQEV